MATIVGDVTGPQQRHRRQNIPYLVEEIKGFPLRVKSFEIVQHIKNSKGWEVGGPIDGGGMNLHVGPRVKSKPFFSFLDGAQLFLVTDVTNCVPCLRSP